MKLDPLNVAATAVATVALSSGLAFVMQRHHLKRFYRDADRALTELRDQQFEHALQTIIEEEGA